MVERVETGPGVTRVRVVADHAALAAYFDENPPTSADGTAGRLVIPLGSFGGPVALDGCAVRVTSAFPSGWTLGMYAGADIASADLVSGPYPAAADTTGQVVTIQPMNGLAYASGVAFFLVLAKQGETAPPAAGALSLHAELHTA